MHIILGGAFNGKRQFVKEQYSETPLQFFEGNIPALTDCFPEHTIVIGRFEEIVKQYSEDESEDEVVAHMLQRLDELAKDRKIICICTDMSRGIVPLEKEKRRQRDVCGRLYQKLCAQADEVTRVWYGLPQILKK